MKSTLLGIGNRGQYHYLIFKKEQRLLQILKKILLNLGEHWYVVDDWFYEGDEEDRAKCVAEGKKLKEVRIDSLTDQRYNFSRNNLNIDIIFGKKKVFLIGHMDLRDRRGILNIIRKDCKFKE